MWGIAISDQFWLVKCAIIFYFCFYFWIISSVTSRDQSLDNGYDERR